MVPRSWPRAFSFFTLSSANRRAPTTVFFFFFSFFAISLAPFYSRQRDRAGQRRGRTFRNADHQFPCPPPSCFHPRVAEMSSKKGAERDTGNISIPFSGGAGRIRNRIPSRAFDFYECRESSREYTRVFPPSCISMPFREIELFFPGNANGRKTKGLHHHSDETGSISPSLPRCHRKLVFHGVAACDDVSESRYYEGGSCASPPPPPDPSFHPILRHSFLFLLRRVFPPSPAYPKGIRNNSSNSSRGNWVNLYAEPRHGKVGTIGEGKTYKQISLPPPLRYDLVLLFFFSLSLSFFLFSFLSFFFLPFQQRI